MERARGTRVTVAAALTLAVVAGCAAGGEPSAGSTPDEERYRVSTVLLAQVGVLQDNMDAFKEELLAQGLAVEFTDANAQGQISNVSTIVNQLSQDPPDLVYVVGTPLVVATAQRLPETPVVFGLMNDPVAAKVAQSLEAPGGMATGTSGEVPPAVTLDLIAQTVPDARRVGLIGNPAEPNTQLEISGFEEATAERGLELVVRPVATTGDVASAVRSLSDVDALIVPSDNTVVSAISTVAQTAQELGLPTYDPGGADLAEQGILYAYGPDYQQLGREAARQAAAILRDGTAPGTIPVAGLRSGSPLQLNINESAARSIGATIPDAVRSRATKVVG